MGAGVLSCAAGFGLSYHPSLYGDRTLAKSFINVGLKTFFWSYYEGYAKARKKTGPGKYADDFNIEKFGELFAAVWDPDVLSRISVWLPALTVTAGNTAAILINDGGENAVWNTGKAYLGDVEVPILAGLISTIAIGCVSSAFTAIGEEAFFRGFEYEELKINLDLVPAKAVNAVSFSALHIPQEIAGGLELSDILIQAGFRAVLTLGLQWAYDDGGLKYSAAQHMWIDASALILNYILCSGIPGEARLSLSINMKL